MIDASFVKEDKMGGGIRGGYANYDKSWSEHLAHAKEEAGKANADNSSISSFRFKEGEAYGHRSGDSNYLNPFSTRTTKKRHYVKATYNAIKNTYGAEIADKVMAGHRGKFYTMTHRADSYKGTTTGLRGSLKWQDLESIDAQLKKLQAQGLAPKIKNMNFDGQEHKVELNAQQLADVTHKVHHPDLPRGASFIANYDERSLIKNGVHKGLVDDLVRCSLTIDGYNYSLKTESPDSEERSAQAQKQLDIIRDNPQDYLLRRIDKNGNKIENSNPPMDEEELRIVSTYVHQGIFASLDQAAMDPNNAASNHPLPYQFTIAGDQDLTYSINSTDTFGVFTFTAKASGAMGNITDPGVNGGAPAYEFVDPRTSALTMEISGTIDVCKEGKDDACKIDHAAISYKATFLSQQEYVEMLNERGGKF